jgi:hypothetical protein
MLSMLGSVGRRPGLPAVVVVVVLSASACGDASDDVRPGMSEDKVRELLGAPTSVATEQADVVFYLGKGDCGTKSTRVLVFERWLREDVFVGMQDATVSCVQTAVLVKAG